MSAFIYKYNLKFFYWYYRYFHCFQECVQFVTCPELLVTLLCVEALEDNEIVIIENVLHIGRINNIKLKADLEPLTPATIVSRTSNRIMLINMLCALPWTIVILTTSIRLISFQLNVCLMDAENFSRLPLSQYEEDNVLRELNKALLGFRQKQQQRLHHNLHQPITRRLSPIGESFSTTPTENGNTMSKQVGISNVSSNKRNDKMKKKSNYRAAPYNDNVW